MSIKNKLGSPSVRTIKPVLTMKGREIREKLSGFVDPRLIFVLEAIAERQSVQQKQLYDCAEVIGRLLQHYENVMHVMGAFREIVEKYKDKPEAFAQKLKEHEAPDER